mmetsp:Transcript_6254/g.13703  ORF Transcript_6254/g.13703 Transcript_6254/m.13703 type:complete len:94 (+) Transcript_6254:458-739(+)
MPRLWNACGCWRKMMHVAKRVAKQGWCMEGATVAATREAESEALIMSGVMGKKGTTDTVCAVVLVCAYVSWWTVGRRAVFKSGEGVMQASLIA